MADDRKIVVSGSLIPSVKNAPLDLRTVVDTKVQIEKIATATRAKKAAAEEVKEDKFYVVKSLKPKMIGTLEIQDSLIDVYEELLDPDMATKAFVQEEIAKAQLGNEDGDVNVDLSAYATVEFVNGE